MSISYSKFVLQVPIFSVGYKNYDVKIHVVLHLNVKEREHVYRNKQQSCINNTLNRPLSQHVYTFKTGS